MDTNPYESPKETPTSHRSHVAKPQTLALLFVIPIVIILAISVLGCGVALYALRFVKLSVE